MHRLLALLVGAGMFLGWNMPQSCPAVSVLDNCFLVRAQAQGQAEADLYPADASAFPLISTFLDVFDASGRFVSGLKPEQLVVIEDGQLLQPAGLAEIVVPLQLTVAINPGPALGVREKPGTPLRFDGIVQALNNWAQALPGDTLDDMSLVSLSGPIIAHASARDWQVSLSSFQQDFSETTPNLQSLRIALDTVSVQAPRVGMKRAILFVTPHMDDPSLETLVQPLIENAIQNQVRIFVWFTDSDLYATTASAAVFNALAVQTGGAYFMTSGLQPYPDPETYFAPLRRLYTLQYNSAVKTGGSHKFHVEVRGQAGTVASGEQAFTVDLQPPNPIFVAPLLQILRTPPQDDPYNTEVLQPAELNIEIVVEFPDGHPRPLVRTTLFVDGQPADENITAPFDSFTWDLSTYRASGEHKLAVEVVDSLNLSKTSIETPVMVLVTLPPRGVAAYFSRYQQYITVGAVVFAGVLLLMILFTPRFRAIFAGVRSSRKEQVDPLTQSVTGGVDARTADSERTGKRRRSLPWKPNPQPPEAPAWLRRLLSDPLAAPGQTFRRAPVSPIPLAAKETTFGTDPMQSSYVLDDPSLEARHARISQTEGGDYFIVDAGTIGGTWVNFEPVGKEARLLRHGDVIHFGQLVFRFELKTPPPAKPPKISKDQAGK